jgi:uncharacterized BrkB/YihY/UPF0761 family membrane protein
MTGKFWPPRKEGPRIFVTSVGILLSYVVSFILLFLFFILIYRIWGPRGSPSGLPIIAIITAAAIFQTGQILALSYFPESTTSKVVIGVVATVIWIALLFINGIYLACALGDCL